MPELRDATPEDMDWILKESRALGGPKMVAQGFLHDLEDHPALVACEGGERVGFVVFKRGANIWLILAIRSVIERQGLGSRMLDALEQRAREKGAEKLRISTSNDNLPALRFLQLRGYTMRQLIPGAVEQSKKLRGLDPEKPLIGRHGIEIRDEILLNKDL